MDVLPQTYEKLVEIQDLVSCQKKSRESTPKDPWRPINTAGENHGGEEQENFRNLPICPTPEEIRVERRPFLRPNLTSRPYASNHLYLDTHFRLLREDFVRPLREGIQELLYYSRQMANDSPPKRMRNDITVYRDTRLVEPMCTRAGVAYVVQFDPQPFKGVRWESSKKLIYGSLVCLSCDNFDTLLYATVSDSEPKDLQTGRVQLIFTEESRDKLWTIQTNRFQMVESPAFFEAYRYVLEGLQEQEEAHLPFQRYIVDCNTHVLPPAYLKMSDTYNLSAIVHPDHRSRIRPVGCLKPEAWPTMEVLGLDESQMEALQLALTKELAIIQGPPGCGKTYVGLKIAQALLTNDGLWSSGAPLLVVCHTNHSLDQFLEGILKFLPTGIVRVGGRSNSEVLKQFNLRELTHDLPRDLPDSADLRTAKKEILKELDEVKKKIKPLLAKLGCSLKGILQEAFLETFMLREHWISLHRPPVPNLDGFEAGGEKMNPCVIMEWLGIDSTLFQKRVTEEAIVNGAVEGATAEDEEMIEIMEQADWIQAERTRSSREEEMDRAMMAGLEEQMLALKIDDTERQASDKGGEMQRHQRKQLRDRIRKELDLSSDMTEEEEKDILNVWLLSLPDRWRLYRLWVARYRMALRNEALQPAEAYQHVVDRLADIQRNERLCVLTKAKVIGMTTTGAAKFRNVIQEVQPRLVIVEEAAQVLEAHIITALSEACQHLILIGDHQQLRPSATVYDLQRYNLEVSMFERLIKMKIPYVKLNSQHRMKPNIAALLTPHIYDELENHPSVMAHEDIMGLKTNLFFLEHDYPEENMRDGTSHQNQHEAKFVLALCRYLILQDYKPQQITILTTYTAQLLCLGKLMASKYFAGVSVHTVDTYQGEENDIILLSLVRSNAEGKVGFLSISNRVCVALSRAKKALYCICNSKMLGRVKLWADIFGTLREKGEIGTALTLRCHNHPDRQVEASCAEDFNQAPQGGCTLRCEISLECGHPCTWYCHPCDPEHKNDFACREPCQKNFQCGHNQMVLCHEDPEKFACQKPCQKMLQCGHNQMVLCHQDPVKFACQKFCQKMRQCGHNQMVLCHQDPRNFTCPQCNKGY